MSTINGYRVKYEVSHIPGRGKGIIAMEPVKEGQVIVAT